MTFLLGPSIKQAEIIKQELGESPGDIERGVRDLQNMLAASPYLPQPEDIAVSTLELFVRGCRMDLDRARNKLKAACLARSRYRDLYEYRSLNEPPLNDVCKFVDIAVLPRLTEEGYRVTIIRIKPDYPESSANITNLVRASLLVGDVRLKDEHLIAGDVFVYEVTHMRGTIVGHIAAAFNAVRRSIQLAQAAYPQRLKRIHVVGCQSIFASSLNLIRTCVTEKIRRRYYLHSKIEDLLDHFSTRELPIEYGGEEESIEKLAKKWRHCIDESSGYMRNLFEVCNANAAAVPVNDVDLYGTVGAFRKLDID